MNAIGLVGLEAAVDLMSRARRVAKIHEHVLRWGDVVEEGLVERGFHQPACARGEPAERDPFPVLQPKDVDRGGAAARQLLTRGISTAIPDGVLRFKPALAEQHGRGGAGAVVDGRRARRAAWRAAATLG